MGDGCGGDDEEDTYYLSLVCIYMSGWEWDVVSGRDGDQFNQKHK